MRSEEWWKGRFQILCAATTTPHSPLPTPNSSLLLKLPINPSEGFFQVVECFPIPQDVFCEVVQYIVWVF